MINRRLLSLALVALLAACSPSPTPAQAYAAAAATSNLVYDTAPDPATATLEEFHAWAGRAIASNQAFAAAVQAIHFDGRTADDVHILITNVAAEQGAASRLAAATTLEQARAIVAAWPRSDAADVVRLDLGLPPAPVRPAAGPS